MTEGAWRVHKSRYKCKEKEVCTGRDCPTCKAKGKCCYKSPIVTNRQSLTYLLYSPNSSLRRVPTSALQVPQLWQHLSKRPHCQLQPGERQAEAARQLREAVARARGSLAAACKATSTSEQAATSTAEQAATSTAKQAATSTAAALPLQRVLRSEHD